MTSVTIRGLDHVVLTVRSIEATLAFYTKVLGMQARTFGTPDQPRHALHFGRQKFNLHQLGQVLDRHVRHATPGSADICLLTDTPMVEVVAHLAACQVSIVEGPAERSGAAGRLWSVYFYDLDENLIEVSCQLGEE